MIDSFSTLAIRVDRRCVIDNGVSMRNARTEACSSNVRGMQVKCLDPLVIFGILEMFFTLRYNRKVGIVVDFAGGKLKVAELFWK